MIQFACVVIGRKIFYLSLNCEKGVFSEGKVMSCEDKCTVP